MKTLYHEKNAVGRYFGSMHFSVGLSEPRVGSECKHLRVLPNQEDRASWLGHANSFISQARPDSVGWSGCGPIAMLIENVLGPRTDAAAKRLSWRLTRSDRFGAEGLRFGEATVSLICEERASADGDAVVNATTDRPFELKAGERRLRLS